MLFGRRRCPIDRETADWVADCVGWMGDRFGREAVLGRQLVLPTGEFLRRDGKSGHELALHVFEQVKTLAGLGDWPVPLEAQEPYPTARLSEFVILGNAPSGPAGSFAHAGTVDTVKITYNPALLDDPVGMVATFAHELAHLLFATSADPPPGGEELEEFATDLGAVFLGFGIFAVNSSFRFAAHGDAFAQGWSYRRQGYLSGNELSFALALFVRVTEAEEGAALANLADRHREPFRAGLRWLDGNPQIASALRGGASA